MTESNSILIRNIYYMLSYAFQELGKNNYDEISKEEFEYIHDLFAEILYKGISSQLKQGLHREYTERHDTLFALRGKLDMNENIRNRLRHRQVLSCEFDELSENNIFNQILKATAFLLIREKSVNDDRKRKLKFLMPFFNGVDLIPPYGIPWSRLRSKLRGQSYKMLMNICYFILNGLLMTTEEGTYKMATFSDDHLNRLFEKFVLEYYRRHHPGLSAKPDQIGWHITDPDDATIDFLPSMQTDIALHKDGRTLIIDTKFYGRMMQQHFGKQTIHSNNLYQIFTYVKNLDKENSGRVSGLLLYARTQETIAPDLDAHFGRNRIMVKTLDLNQNFECLRKQLDAIAASIFSVPAGIVTSQKIES